MIILNFIHEAMMPPFPGVNLHETDPGKESFNFYHSQVRIIVERVFGIFIWRFGYFWKANSCDLNFFIEIIHCCVRLHNFIHDKRIPNLHPRPPSVAVDEEGRLLDPMWRLNAGPRVINDGSSSQGNSLRDLIKDRINNEGLHRVRSHHR
jgi:hypothetical protein